ncbi:MAG: HAMP domain-containing protein, partial [Erysipelotrichaceae bacterium]|nr:HAMP domain-containing protein [Erysipelotrichaceae bacterium]
MRKLTVRLLLACLSCAVLGLCVYRLTYVVGMTVVNRMLNDESYTDQLLQNEVERIQELVDQNRMTEEEIPVLQQDLPYTVAVVGSKNQSAESSSDSTAVTSVPPTEQAAEPTLKNSFLVETAGGFVEMVIFPNFASGYENLVNVTGMFAGFLVFGMSFILIIRKRVVYIQQLISEVNLLESGNLEIPVTVKGEDELADLAQSMEDMRKAT